MRILLWHVHGAWTTAFVQGGHDYLVPTTPDRGPYGLGRARTYRWPDNVREVSPEALVGADVDVVLLQRPEEEEIAHRWLGRRVPTIFLEHNTPKQGDVPCSRHPMADRDDLTLVHVTHFNKLIWDNGSTRTEVIEHGIPDPGQLYSGELGRIATAINEPIRRWRVTGTDLLPRFADVAPVDVYGMKVTSLPEHLGLAGERMEVFEDPPQAQMHAAVAQRRVYLHPHRWTSLGLSLLEAMSAGTPVVVLATTETVMAVPPGAGVLSTDVDELVEGARWLVSDIEAARRCGEVARRVAQTRYGLARFLADWDALLKEVTS
ncbi:glycosyltransferase family 4 protein [Planosporangium flavigriseum]|uniref:Glycosyl transferase n=1 Tax=Planosporangium flavigriseum TaxID=373681 RepID=A0A8J3PMZ0_9ACTN|nr:glycosyltransferase [Planosporangium flavigriseum]NJC63409.1 glycosyltransferase family 4 protein [Planosporangium flavigriseum]GIG75392.1 glycosyl transferase [Planosporangium flavigriseum]